MITLDQQTQVLMSKEYVTLELGGKTEFCKEQTVA